MCRALQPFCHNCNTIRRGRPAVAMRRPPVARWPRRAGAPSINHKASLSTRGPWCVLLYGRYRARR
eukprot:1738155-Prymnesium_polylepis.1